jgi:hypothetical protein
MIRTWLGGSSVGRLDPLMPRLVESAAAMCQVHPQLHFIVNFYDSDPTPFDADALVRQHSRNSSCVEGTHVAGMKTVFWKRVITPDLLRARNVELVWLVDSDIAIHPSAFPLGTLAGVLESTNATLLQPSIRALVHGTYHSFLRVKNAHMSCVATSAQFVELQCPVFAAEAWSAYHSRVLSHIADKDLAESDYGIDISWCAAVREAFPGRPACLVTPGETATHLNTHTIEKFMDKEIASKVRSCAGTCQTLFRLFPRYWKNYSHHNGNCYGLSPTRAPLPDETPQLDCPL